MYEFNSNSMWGIKKATSHFCGQYRSFRYRECRDLVKNLADDNVDFEKKYLDLSEYEFPCDSETCSNDQYSKRKFGRLSSSYQCYANDYFSRRRRSIATGNWFKEWCISISKAALDFFAPSCVDDNGDPSFRDNLISLNVPFTYNYVSLTLSDPPAAKLKRNSFAHDLCAFSYFSVKKIKILTISAKSTWTYDLWLLLGYQNMLEFENL